MASDLFALASGIVRSHAATATAATEAAEARLDGLCTAYRAEIDRLKADLVLATAEIETLRSERDTAQAELRACKGTLRRLRTDENEAAEAADGRV